MNSVLSADFEASLAQVLSWDNRWWYCGVGGSTQPENCLCCDSTYNFLTPYFPLLSSSTLFMI